MRNFGKGMTGRIARYIYVAPDLVKLRINFRKNRYEIKKQNIINIYNNASNHLFAFTIWMQ